jgi:hypothetical protein
MAGIEIEVDDQKLVQCLQELKKRMDQGYNKSDCLACAGSVLESSVTQEILNKRAQLITDMHQQLGFLYDQLKVASGQPKSK